MKKFLGSSSSIFYYVCMAFNIPFHKYIIKFTSEKKYHSIVYYNVLFKAQYVE